MSEEHPDIGVARTLGEVARWARAELGANVSDLEILRDGRMVLNLSVSSDRIPSSRTARNEGLMRRSAARIEIVKAHGVSIRATLDRQRLHVEAVQRYLATSSMSRGPASPEGADPTG